MKTRVVDQVLVHPGCCPITGKGEGPFVETELIVQYAGARFTPIVELCVELGEAVGMVPGDMAAQAVRSLEDELEELKAWKAAAEKDLEDYVALRGAVTRILRGGVTVNKSGAVTLTPWPGVQTPRDLDEATAIERLEGDRAEG